MGSNSRTVPPWLPPRPGLGESDELHRMRFRFWQFTLTLITVLITTWLITLGPIPGIIAVVTAKHVLVAILVMGLGVDAPSEPKGEPEL
jgi:hypothetical protein